jgi:hypothetical protein
MIFELYFVYDRAQSVVFDTHSFVTSLTEDQIVRMTNVHRFPTKLVFLCSLVSVTTATSLILSVCLVSMVECRMYVCSFILCLCPLSYCVGSRCMHCVLLGNKMEYHIEYISY